ncbi:MAG: 50S ribosomal protein L29 [Clostridia bacterium]|nr:50S ribosomal protein L29 [Clostridia bacterium]
MAIKEFKELNLKELNDKLIDLKDELYKLRFQLAINQLENPMRITAVKKDIARVKTLIREIEIKDSQNA